MRNERRGSTRTSRRREVQLLRISAITSIVAGLDTRASANAGAGRVERFHRGPRRR